MANDVRLPLCGHVPPVHKDQDPWTLHRHSEPVRCFLEPGQGGDLNSGPLGRELKTTPTATSSLQTHTIITTHTHKTQPSCTSTEGLQGTFGSLVRAQLPYIGEVIIQSIKQNSD